MLSKLPHPVRRLARKIGLRRTTAAQDTFPPVCPNVGEWAVRSGYYYQLLRSAKTIHFDPPETIEPDTQEQFRSFYHRTLPEKYLALIPNAEILGWLGVIRLPDGSYPSEVIYGWTHYLKEARGYHPLLDGPVEYLDGPCFSLSFLWWKNYGHWYRDVLGQLYGVLAHLPRETRFVVPRKLTPVHYATLHALGLRDEQLVLIDSAQQYRVEWLYFTPHAEEPAAAWQWLSERILSYYGIERVNRGRRIYISRRNFPSRRVLNEPELKAYLAPLGFETVTPETLGHREQVELFSGADVIVGSHGGGLTNALFSAPSCRVLDILTTTYVDRFHWEMCRALGQRYLYFFGETIADEQGIGGKNTNQIIPIEKLERALHRIGIG